MRILICAEEREARSLERVLKQSGIHIDTCNSVENLHHTSLTERYAAVILKGGRTEKNMIRITPSQKPGTA